MDKTYLYSIKDGWAEQPDALTALMWNAMCNSIPFLEKPNATYSESAAGTIKFDLPPSLQDK